MIEIHEEPLARQRAANRARKRRKATVGIWIFRFACLSVILLLQYLIVIEVLRVTG